MENPRTVYNRWLRERGASRAKTDAYHAFTSKYHEEEGDGSRSTARWFSPGTIYTYAYDPAHKARLDFYDRRPVIMSLGHFKAKTTGNDIELALNLNFLPQRERLNLLYLLWKERNANAARGRALVMAVTEEISGTDFAFSIRSYIRERIVDPRWVSGDDWGIIPLIETQMMTGKRLDQIHRYYHALARARGEGSAQEREAARARRRRGVAATYNAPGAGWRSGSRSKMKGKGTKK